MGYFAVGGGLAVVLSFAVIGFFVGATTAAGGYPRLNLVPMAAAADPADRAGLWAACGRRPCSLFLLVILTGLFGTQTAGEQPDAHFRLDYLVGGNGLCRSPAGQPVASGQSLENPLRTWPKPFIAALSPQGELDGGRNYPESWGVWPAAILFFAFAWIENALPEAAAPALLAGLIVAYSLLTLGGMYLFGPQQWLRQGEVFSVIYGILTPLCHYRGTGGGPGFVPGSAMRRSAGLRQ